MTDAERIAELTEKLAALEHERWSGWMRYLFTKGEDMPRGGFIIAANSVKWWRRQMETDYASLTEAEKESDRKEAKKTLAALAPEFGRIADLERQNAALEHCRLDFLALREEDFMCDCNVMNCEACAELDSKIAKIDAALSGPAPEAPLIRGACKAGGTVIGPPLPANYVPPKLTKEQIEKAIAKGEAAARAKMKAEPKHGIRPFESTTERIGVAPDYVPRAEVEKAVQEEREACAAAADYYVKATWSGSSNADAKSDQAEEIASDIRARSKP